MDKLAFYTKINTKEMLEYLEAQYQAKKLEGAGPFRDGDTWEMTLLRAIKYRIMASEW